MSAHRQGWIEEFHQQHGASILVKDERVVYFADGSWHENSLLGVALHAEDMTLLERLSNIVKYHEERLRRAVVAFDELREKMIHDSRGYENEEENLQRLKAQQATVNQIRDELQRAIDERNKNDPRYVSPESARRQEEYRQQLEAKQSTFASKVKKIEI